MGRTRGCLIGCGAFAFIVAMMAITAYLLWTAPPDVPIPPAPTPPPNNAFDAYVQLARKTYQIEQRTPNLPRLHQEIARHTVDTATLRRFVSVYEPIRREYRKHVDKPSQVTASDTRLVGEESVLSAFRGWGRVEVASIRLAFREGDYARAIDDLRTALLLAEGIRRGGQLISFLTGEGMLVSALGTFAEGLDKLSAAECDRVVKVVREWERVRVPFWQALEGEKRFILKVYAEMHETGSVASLAPGAPSGDMKMDRGAARMMNLRKASREVVQLFDSAIAESKKPYLKRQPIEQPEHPLNQSWWEMLRDDPDRSVFGTARLRMLACAAAVRAYRLRSGRYPETLSQAGVADLNVDPFTGEDFVYRVGSKGFLLYAIGTDGKDNGGKRVPEARRMEGEGDCSLYPYVVSPTTTQPGPEIWLK